MKTQTRLIELETNAGKVGLFIRTYSPGDGMTRYRFFDNVNRSYDSGGEIFTALGLKEANTFVTGYVQGYAKGRYDLAQEYEDFQSEEMERMS